MGCGISKSSVRIVSSAHVPPEVPRSANYKPDSTPRDNASNFDSSFKSPRHNLSTSLNQSHDQSGLQSPRFNNFTSETPVQRVCFNQLQSQTNIHQTSFNRTKSQSSLHQTSFNNTSLLPEIGSDIDETILWRPGRRIRLDTEHTAITRKSSDSESSQSLEEISETRSLADGRSIGTTRTVITTRSTVSGRTKSTFLQRSNYDFNEQDEGVSPVTYTTQSNYGTQKRPEVVQRIPVRPPVAYGGNHFWWPSKRMLFSDYRHVRQLDKAVAQVSPALGLDPLQLVAHLKGHCEDDVDIARTIYRWISNNITFQPDSNNNSKDPTYIQIIRARKGNARDLGRLYQYFCLLAKLECELVEGLCKYVNFFPGLVAPEDLCQIGCPMYHTWNKIRLCKRWYLLDVALSQQGCSMAHREELPSLFSEEMFLPRPSDIICTHLPMTLHSEQLTWDTDSQLLGDSPVVDLQAWAESVVRTVAANEWGIKPLSHQRGVIETDENEVWLQFMCPNIMQYHMCLEAPDLGLEYQGHALIYLQEDILTAYIRLPGPGTYIARLYAQPCYVKPGAEGLGCKLVMIYTIRATGGINQLPFSTTFDGLWSITPQLYDTGCRVLSTKGAEIMAIDGRVSVDLRLPLDGIFPNLVWFCKAREENINLDGYIYAEREGRLARIHLLCPSPGEYILLLQVPVEDPTSAGEISERSAYARFFISCTSPATTSEGTPTFPLFEHCLSGPLESIDAYGLWLPNQIGSTLYAEQGCCQFLLRQDRPVRVVHSVEGESGVTHREATRWVFAERNGYDVNYQIMISEPGRFRITLSAGDYDTSDLEIVCVLMVDTLVAYNGDLYPECNTIWGAEPLFHQLGLCSDVEEQSRIPVKNGHASVSIRARRDIPLLPKLFHANDKSMDMTEHRVACRNDLEIEFYMTLPFKGYYTLKITNNDQQVACYLLNCEVPAKPALPYEPFHTVYGTTEAFHHHGLKEVKDEQNTIKTTQNGKCLIRHTAPRGFPVYFCLVKNNKEIKGCVYAERLSSEVVYHIELQVCGYYRFTCWSRFDDGKRDDLLFSYLLYCPEDQASDAVLSNPYPQFSEIWGLNTHGFTCGVSIRNQQSSTIKAIKGIASLSISYPDDVMVTYILEHPELTLHEAKRCLFVEHASNNIRHLSISLPSMGRYILKLSAKKETEGNCQPIGAFLIVSNEEEPGVHSFPVFSNFYEGCRLGEPKINPLSAGTEYFFQLEVPGARMIQLWDGMGRWRALLEPQEGSDVISGMVDVGDPKELWVAGMYDAEYCYGNGGFRDLLMYDVV